MSARQTGSELKMLAAGLLLGRLVLRKPQAPAPEPVVVRIAEPAPKPKRKRDFLANNAVIAGIVSAVVAGGTSFLVAHYQSQDTAKQAAASQQVTVAGQIESAATTYFDDAEGAFSAIPHTCFTNLAACPAGYKADLSKIYGDQLALNLAQENISDDSAANLITAMNVDLYNVFYGPNKAASLKGAIRFSEDYNDLLFRCGQLIQGKT